MKTSQNGSLEDFPAIKTLSSHLPGAFVKATRVITSLKTVNAATWLDEYYFRIIFLIAMIEDQSNIEVNRFKIERFADIVRENHAMADLGSYVTIPSTVQQLHADPTEIEYRPPEDGLDTGAGARINAMAMTVKVTVLSTIA